MSVSPWLLRVIGIAGLACGQIPAFADSQPPLGAAASFVVLGGSAVRNSGATVVTGNVGVSPGNSVTGFPPGKLAVGGVFSNDAVAREAHNDSIAAYNDLAARACDGAPATQPGVHCISPTLHGPLTLAGSATDIWVFRVTGSLTVDPAAAVRLSGGAISSNVFWQVGGSVTVGTRSSFVGTILANGDITFDRVASMSGRALSLNGVVTIGTDDLTLCCDPLDIAPSSLPNGTANTSYLATLSGRGGTALYTFSIFDGALPPGMTLTSSGTLSGTPTTPGTFTVTVRVTDAHGCSGLRTYTIMVCSVSTLTATQLPDATVCVKYVATVVAGAAINLPPWLIQIEDGKVGGLPPAVEDVMFSVVATDDSGCPFTQPYKLHVNCGIVPAPSPLPKGTVGQPYFANIAASCGVEPFTYEVIENMVPPGLSSPPAISGTPTKPGSYPFTVKITDSSSPFKCTTNAKYTIDVSCGTLTFSRDTLPGGDICTNYNESIKVSGGLSPYTFAVTDLPPNLTFAPMPPDTGTTLTLSGPPVTPGTFDKVKVVATDQAGCSETKSYVITIAPPIALTLLTETLPAAQIGVLYTQPITVSCGDPPIALAVTAGTLPDGLTLCPGNTICGTPTAFALSRRFTITATDALGVTGSREYTICLPITIDPPALPDGNVDAVYKTTLTAGGGAGPFEFSPPNVTDWLSLSKTTGILSGKPAMAVDYTFTVSATDTPTGCTGMRTYTVRIRPPCAAITLTPPSELLLPLATVSVAYSQVFTASGGTPPYQFRAAVLPSLPPGLSLSTSGPTSGTLMGTPTQTGHFNFVAVATDANGLSNCSDVYTVVVEP